MNNQVAYIISNSGIINLTVGSEVFVIDPGHTNYKIIKKGLSTLDGQKLKELASVSKAIEKFGQGKVQVIDGEVIFEGEPLHNSLTDRILNMMSEGFPITPMLRFLENLMDNPSAQSIAELYDFLEHKGLPITEDGCFLAYKGIRTDWKDKYSGLIDNSIGQKPFMKRRDVDDNRLVGCSTGLHAGTLEYVSSYCTDRVIQVKINPKHVVSVPSDSSHQKIRVETYEVMQDITDNFVHMNHSVYQKDGKKWDQHELEDEFEEDGPITEDDDPEIYEDEYDEDEYDPCLDCPEGKLCNKCEHDH